VPHTPPIDTPPELPRKNDPKEIAVPSGITTPHYRTTSKLDQGPSRQARLRAWLKRYELDASLDNGASPEDSEQLAVRAWQIAQPSARAHLARSLERLVARAGSGPWPSSLKEWLMPGPMPVRREEVQANRPLVLDLANRLRDERPVGLTGLIKARRLISDGDGPMFSEGRTPLDVVVRSAMDALEPQAAPDTPRIQVGVQAEELSSGRRRRGHTGRLSAPEVSHR
jgi:hypothetical protein